MCDKEGNFLCTCKLILLCTNHLPEHIDQPGHSVENLSQFLTHSDSQALKKEVLVRLDQIKKSKAKIYSLGNKIIAKINTCIKAANKELDELAKFYSFMLSFEKFPKTLKLEAEKIMSTSLNIKEISIEISSDLQESFTEDLISTDQKKKNYFFRGNDKNEIKKTEIVLEPKKYKEVEKIIDQIPKDKDEMNKVKINYLPEINKKVKNPKDEDEIKNVKFSYLTEPNKNGKNDSLITVLNCSLFFLFIGIIFSCWFDFNLSNFNTKTIAKFNPYEYLFEDVHQGKTSFYLTGLDNINVLALEEKKSIVDLLKIEDYDIYFGKDNDYYKGFIKGVRVLGC